MKRILLIKLTSIGDLIHALPAISDAYRAYPEIEFDWVIDENFQEVATWHPAIKQTFTTNHRKWRRDIFQRRTSQVIYRLIKTLRKTRYDLIIDGQGNFKTALLTMLTKGVTAGFDKYSVREKIAHFAYQKKCRSSRQTHAVQRLRELFSQALNYPLPTTPPDFHIDQERFVKPSIELPSSYIVFVHNATWKTKLWPEAYWLELVKKTTEAGFTVLLPWGNFEEEARAKRLAIFPGAKVLPRLSLSEIGYVIARAQACICMDTGLSHLAGALNIPSLTLYGATDPKLIGATGGNQFHLQSNLECTPCSKKECPFSSTTVHPPCLAQITPDRVFQRFLALISTAPRTRQ